MTAIYILASVATFFASIIAFVAIIRSEWGTSNGFVLMVKAVLAVAILGGGIFTFAWASAKWGGDGPGTICLKSRNPGLVCNHPHGCRCSSCQQHLPE